MQECVQYFILASCLNKILEVFQIDLWSVSPNVSFQPTFINFDFFICQIKKTVLLWNNKINLFYDLQMLHTLLFVISYQVKRFGHTCIKMVKDWLNIADIEMSFPIFSCIFSL